MVNQGRYDRNLSTISHEEQALLARSHVAVIGLGGLGGGVCEMLARTGVGTLTLVDGDIFDTTNLNRQLLSREENIGGSKARAAKERIFAVNSTIQINALQAYADETNFYGMIQGADVVVDCLDTIDTRFLLQESAQRAGLPIVSGAIAGVCGQVTVIFPQDSGYELIYGKKKQAHSPGVETQTGNISYCALFIASLQASECIKVLLKRGDILRNKLLIADLWSNSFEVMDLL
ncbi:MAG: HesA/MoeB/ThiF family protein [Deltaproteobacteria bacterium]|nr:MAG: HesA/MoeB/ThiF family protein [Deltaproteobacteria bacterium]